MKNDPQEQAILRSWNANVTAWVGAIANNEIASRTLVTNGAILDTLTKYAKHTVLDIGCGEGWLVRALAAKGFSAMGLDGVPGLVAKAREQGEGNFDCVGYDELGDYETPQRYDLAVCNFSLIGKHSVENVFKAVPALLSQQGIFIVQTLHPRSQASNEKYQDGWRKGSWDGFGSDFCDPAPWYFRTTESWIALFDMVGFSIAEILEPRHPATGDPLSIIFVGRIEYAQHSS